MIESASKFSKVTVWSDTEDSDEHLLLEGQDKLTEVDPFRGFAGCGAHRVVNP